LPEIDLILLSHAHLDHLDLASLKSVRGTPSVVTAGETSDLLQGLQVQCPRELRWGNATTVKTAHGEVRVEAFEVKHWGRRWPRGKERGYNGYIVERDGRRILFGGDTGFTGSFTALKSRGPFAAALMPIGSYNPWIRNHCTPEEAVQMALAAGAERIAPIHYASFKFSDEPVGEPLERFEVALAKESSRIAWRRIGESVACT
jgi:L-ascorbate metabolism protein UlaG (beta-lactamase superfamily)